MDLHLTPFENVYNYNDPNVAMAHQIDLFREVINKHAPPPPQKKEEEKEPGETPRHPTMAEHWYKASHDTEGQIYEAKTNYGI